MNFSDKYELVKYASALSSEEEMEKQSAALLSKLQSLGSKGKDLAKSYFDVVSGKNLRARVPGLEQATDNLDNAYFRLDRMHRLNPLRFTQRKVVDSFQKTLDDLSSAYYTDKLKTDRARLSTLLAASLAATGGKAILDGRDKSASEEEISKSAASLLPKLQSLGSKGKDLAKSYFDVVRGKNIKGIKPDLMSATDDLYNLTSQGPIRTFLNTKKINKAKDALRQLNDLYYQEKLKTDSARLSALLAASLAATGGKAVLDGRDKS